jgi:hypothetical protein
LASAERRYVEAEMGEWRMSRAVMVAWWLEEKRRLISAADEG